MAKPVQLFVLLLLLGLGAWASETDSEWNSSMPEEEEEDDEFTMDENSNSDTDEEQNFDQSDDNESLEDSDEEEEDDSRYYSYADAQYMGIRCGYGGTCRSRSQYQCQHQWLSGLCRGSSDVMCCHPSTRTSTSTRTVTAATASVARSDYIDIPLTKENWDMAWNSPIEWTNINGKPAVRVAPPMEMGSSTGTSAPLLLSSRKYSKNFDLKIVAKTCMFTRANPNNWELFWMYFNFNAKKNQYGYEMATKTANSFYVGRYRYELGTGSGTLGQKFIKTGDLSGVKACPWTKGQGFASCSNSCNKLYTYRVRKIGQEVDVWWGEAGTEQKLFSKICRSPALYNDEGRLGLYAEDAIFEVQSVSLMEL